MKTTKTKTVQQIASEIEDQMQLVSTEDEDTVINLLVNPIGDTPQGQQDEAEDNEDEDDEEEDDEEEDDEEEDDEGNNQSMQQEQHKVKKQAKSTQKAKGGAKGGAKDGTKGVDGGVSKIRRRKGVQRVYRKLADDILVGRIQVFEKRLAILSDKQQRWNKILARLLDEQRYRVEDA